jgi:hypothetical protein
MKASVLSFQAAVIFVVVGMIWGLVMAISVDHATRQRLAIEAIMAATGCCEVARGGTPET